jgi:hypothetical protein
MGRELDHTPPSSAEDKNEWSLTPAFPVGLHILKRILRFELLAAAFWTLTASGLVDVYRWFGEHYFVHN